MATLSQVSRETRAVFKVVGILLGVLLVLFFILSIKNTLFPAPPPPPTVSFGKLLQIDFPTSISNQKFSYSVDTISGNLPALPSSVKVYKMYETSPDLLSLAHAQELAQAIGFSSKANEISENVYQWKDLDTNRTLTMNILNYNFNLSSNFLFKSDIPNFKDTDVAISTSKNFLSNLNLFSVDLDDAQTKTDLLMVKNYRLVPADSPSSQMARVNFYQKPVDGLSIYYPSLVSPMNFLVGKSSQGPSIFEANFFHQKISDNFATYPIKTASEALDQLKKEEGYISQAPSNSQISIKNINLGYYISEKKQLYMLPIIVFSGDNFRAFIPAIKDEWITANK